MSDIEDEVKCSECPNARHGFDRDASHNAGRYVCECESHKCTVEALRQQLAAAKEDASVFQAKITAIGEAATGYDFSGGLEDYVGRAFKQLAASQLQNAQLRSLIDRSFNDHDHKWSDDAIAALALPANTSALEAMIAKAGEVMRERCAKSCDVIGNNRGFSCATAIRALPGVTMEDIK